MLYLVSPTASPVHRMSTKRTSLFDSTASRRFQPSFPRAQCSTHGIHAFPATGPKCMTWNVVSGQHNACSQWPMVQHEWGACGIARHIKLVCPQHKTIHWPTWMWYVCALDKHRLSRGRVCVCECTCAVENAQCNMWGIMLHGVLCNITLCVRSDNRFYLGGELVWLAKASLGLSGWPVHWTYHGHTTSWQARLLFKP